MLYSILFHFLLAYFGMIQAFEWPTITFKHKNQCNVNQTYDIQMLNCEECTSSNLAVPKDSGFGCKCRYDSRTIQDTGFLGKGTNSELKCAQCPAKHAPTRDGRYCIKCPDNANVTESGCKCLPETGSGYILIEREVDGKLLGTAKCVKCAPGSKPSLDRTQCEPCLYYPIIDGQNESCNCSNLIGGLCLPPNYKSDGFDGITFSPTSLSNFQVEFYKNPEGSTLVNSAFFKEHLEASIYMCNKFHNATACQVLGNLCTLALHARDHPACKVLHELIYRKRYEEVPRLFYDGEKQKIPINREDITTVYKLRETDTDYKVGSTKDPRSHRLNMTLVSYSLNGHLTSIETVNGAMFQMCNGSLQEFDAAFNFGTRYEKKCQIPAHLLFYNAQNPTFYDLYIPYKSDSAISNKLFAVPINILNKNGQANEKNSDEERKELTTRFFLVDSLTGKSDGKDQNNPEVVRYLKKFHIQIDMLNTNEFPKKAGRIFPPLVNIEYGVVTPEDVEEGIEMDFEFKVSYKMEMREARKDIEIAMGVLSAFALLWSAMETWSWSRRSGKSGIDPYTLSKLIMNTCGNLANVFLAVVFFTSIYWFIFFKQQNYIHAILPTKEQERLIKDYVISIFALKLVDIAHLLFCQMTVDLFLIDWEQPKPGSVNERNSSGQINPKTGVNSTKDMAVSVWRTYLVANEWNEIQTVRKISHSLQIILVVLVLHVCGVENLATADPLNVLDLKDGQYHSEFSYVCRFSLGVAIYISIALGQIILWCGFYNHLIEDKLEQFTDVCSLANISMFAMAQNNFGYYIHGKSAHGFSDTDMATLLDQLQRESEDLCGHRGLLAGTDDQTFSMALPIKLRNYYDKIVIPATTMGSAMPTGPRAHKLTGSVVQQMVSAYGTMNKFLTRFLEHALKDLDFEVRDRLFLESVMDMEFQDTSITDKAIFYKDSGHSFDALLFYGHEFTLLTFDIMIFSFVDLFVQNFLLAGIVTYFVGKLLVLIRQVGGKSNLSKKTLIDRRFLI